MPIKANAGAAGIMYKTANGSLAAITLLDTGATNPTSRAWSVYRWPSNIASAPTIANNTSNPASFTPPQDRSTYTIKLHRVNVTPPDTDEYLIIEVPDSSGRAIPSAGTDAALLNASQAMLDTGWAGGAVAGEKLLETLVRDGATGIDILTAAVAVHETRLDTDETDIANLQSDFSGITPATKKLRTRVTTNATLNVAYNHYEVDTTGGAVTLTVPGSSTTPADEFFEISHVLGNSPVLLTQQTGHEADAIVGLVPYRGGLTLVNDATGNWFGQNSWCSLYGIQIPNDAVISAPASNIIQCNTSGGIVVGDSGDTDTIRLLAGSYVSIGVSGTADELTISKVSTSVVITGIENDLKFSSSATITLDINSTKLGKYQLSSGYADFLLDTGVSGFIFETSASSQLLAFKALGNSCYVSFQAKLGHYFVSDGVSALSVEKTVISLFSSGGAASGGDKILYLANRTTAPTANPTGGGLVYEEAGALLHRGTGGTITTIAPA